MKIIILLLLTLIGTSCEYNEFDGGEQPSNLDYLLFGHLNGFCMQCDAVYKIQNGKLEGLRNQTISDPSTANLLPLTDEQYQLVKTLINQVPPRLIIVFDGSIRNLGSAFPDAGHYYVEVSKAGKLYRWYLEAGNLPQDVQTFVSSMQDALAKLQ